MIFYDVILCEKSEILSYLLLLLLLDHGQSEQTGSIVWICTTSPSGSQVTVVDATNPGSPVDKFPISNAHVLCIAYVPGINTLCNCLCFQIRSLLKQIPTAAVVLVNAMKHWRCHHFSSSVIFEPMGDRYFSEVILTEFENIVLMMTRDCRGCNV